MINCSCKAPECGNYIATDKVTHMIFMTKDNPKGTGESRENAMYLDPNSIVALIMELREMLEEYVTRGE